MENAKITNSLKYLKRKKSFVRLKQIQKLGMDPERIKLLPWFDNHQVVIGLHMDNENIIGSQWVGWVLYEDGEVLTQTFENKLLAHDWIISKGERHIRKRKIRNHLTIYKLIGFTLLVVFLVLFLVIKLYT